MESGWRADLHPQVEPRRPAGCDTARVSEATIAREIRIETAWDRISRRIQPPLAAFFTVMAVLAVRPVDDSAGSVLRIALIALCACWAATVPVPDRYVDERMRLALACGCALTAGILLGVAGQGWPGTFSYMLGVHAGVKFPPRVAIGVMVLCSASAMVAGQIHPSPADPWWANLVVVAALIPGMSRRAAHENLRAAQRVVEQTRRAAESEARSRALAERAAIARDIHDVLAHSLSGVNMQLNVAEALLDAGRAEEGRTAVGTAHQLVVSGLREARNAVQALRGDTVDLSSALRGMVTGAERYAESGTPYPVSARAVHTLVRTAQEALTNARRHAAGAPVAVLLEYADADVVLTVANAPSDDGASEAGSGLGLVGMRERADLLGARLVAGPLGASDSGDVPACAPYPPNVLVGGWRVRLEVPRDDEGV